MLNEEKVAVAVLLRGVAVPRRWGAVVWWPGGVLDGAGDAVAVAWESRLRPEFVHAALVEARRRWLGPSTSSSES